MKERQSQGKCGGRKGLLGYAPNPATQQNRALSKITSWGVRVHWKKTDEKFRRPDKMTQHHYTKNFRPVCPEALHCQNVSNGIRFATAILQCEVASIIAFSGICTTPLLGFLSNSVIPRNVF
jgi:hypothetical protein